MKLRQTFFLAIATLAFAAFNSAFAGETLHAGDLVQKQKSIAGDWEIVAEGDRNYVVFKDNFKAKNGPDLKIFLSPMELSKVNGKTATKGSVLVAKLKSVKGGQKYPIPGDIDLSNYRSVLVHCEKYAVLWGGGMLN